MFDSIIAYNNGEYVAAFGGYNEQADTVKLSGGNSLQGDGWIRTASMNRHIWYGVISTFEHNFSEQLSLVLGLMLDIILVSITEKWKTFWGIIPICLLRI